MNILATFSRYAGKKIFIFMGALLLLLLPVWIYIIVPSYLEIEPDFSARFEVDSYDNFYNLEGSSYLGEQKSLTNFAYETVGEKNGNLEIRNSFEVKSLSGEPIFSTSRLYGVDPETGMHAKGSGDADREGYLFAPRMKGLFYTQAPDKSSFTYWHVNYNTPILMEYKAEETIYGLKVYRYRSNFKADQTKELTGSLEGVGVDKGIELDGVLELWIEPYTGTLIWYADSATAYHYDLESKERLHPWNSFRNQVSVPSVVERVEYASVLKTMHIIFEEVVPACVVFLSIAFFLFGYALRAWKKYQMTKGDQEQYVVLPVIAAILVLLFAFFVAYAASLITKQQVEIEFNTSINKINAEILNSLEFNSAVVRSGRGLFESSENVTREEWKKFVNGFDLERNYPSIQAFGYARIISDENKESFIASVRAEGFPEFDIFPESQSDQYAVVTYIEPFDSGNQRGLGFNKFSEPFRRGAMELARDTNDIVMTSKINILKINSQEREHGFNMYAPIFDPGGDLRGYVFVPFRMQNFMNSVFLQNGTRIGVEIFDGDGRDGLTENNLMYKNDAVSPDSAYQHVSVIDFQNHKWSIRYTAPKDFAFDIVKSFVPIAVMVVGGVIAAFVFVLVYLINTRRVKAVEIARQMTKDLEESKNEVIERSNVLERLNKVMVDRELKMKQMKDDLDNLRKNNGEK